MLLILVQALAAITGFTCLATLVCLTAMMGRNRRKIARKLSACAISLLVAFVLLITLKIALTI